MKSLEITANSYDAALEKALEELQLTKDDVEVQLIKESGLLRKKVTLLVTQKKAASDLALDFITNVIEKLGIDCVAEIAETDDAFNVRLSGEDTGVLIGYRGDVLDSLQYLALLVANKNNPLGKRLVIDGENYRDKRIATLSRLAKKLAFRVAKTGRPEELEPMNPFERRIIHSALSDDRFVTTESIGEEPNRYIVIKPKRRSYDRGERSEHSGNYGKHREHSDGERRGRYDDRPRERRAPAPSVSSKPQEQPVNHDAYDPAANKSFNRTGIKRMRSFGQKRKTF